MKRSIAAWILVILIAAGGVIAAVYFDSSNEARKQNDMAKNKQSETQKAATTETRKTAAAQPGVYAEYQEGLVASTDGVKLLFFHAPWCPQCRMIENDIKNQGVPDGVTVLKVDYDSNQALREKYNVTLQTTFVKIDDIGNELAKFVAYNDPTFDSVDKNLLGE